MKYKITKATIKMIGRTDMLRNVICGPAVSMDFPMIGNTMEVATKPAPPRIDIPSAPLRGIYSEATPIMVGQK